MADSSRKFPPAIGPARVVPPPKKYSLSFGWKLVLIWLAGVAWVLLTTWLGPKIGP
ncbi:MAG: hypothetical protein HY420_03575 [Candidatus Kerfeldbacteria bacterium]|nr:hypothetical protein [Candidatus Kerfeldbacteria bacterium]